MTHPCQSNGCSTKQTKLCCFRGPHASMCHTSIWLCTQLRTIGHVCSFHKGRQGAHWIEPKTIGIRLGIQKNHMPIPKLTFRTKPPRPPQQSWITGHGDKRQKLTRYGDGMSYRKRLLRGTINPCTVNMVSKGLHRLGKEIPRHCAHMCQSVGVAQGWLWHALYPFPKPF